MININMRFVKIINIIFLTLMSCGLKTPTIPIYIDENRYGWYFVFLEIDSNLSKSYSEEAIMMCDSNVFFIKIQKGYNFDILQCKDNLKIKDKMKIVTLRGGGEQWCLNFYYPYPGLEFDEYGFNPVYDSISKEGNIEFDSIIKKYNINL